MWGDWSWWTCLSKTCAFASGSHARQSSLTDLPRVEERRREAFKGALRWDRGGSIAKTLLQPIVFFGRNWALSGLLTRAKTGRVPSARLPRTVVLEPHHFCKDF